MENKFIGSKDANFYDRFSHELRTTLTGVIGYSEHIEHSVSDPMTKFSASVINQGGKDILRVFGAYLDFVRLQSGQINLRPSIFSVVNLVNEIMLEARKSAHHIGVKLILNCDDQVWCMRMTSDLNVFKRIVDLILHDLVFSAAREDLIEIILCSEGFVNYFELKFLIHRLNINPKTVMLHKQFWQGGGHQKQEGPGVCSALAKDFICMLSGSVKFSHVENESFCIAVGFPLAFREI